MALSCISGLRHPFDIFKDYVNGETKIFAETSEATNWILISGYHGSKLRYGNFDDRFEISM